MDPHLSLRAILMLAVAMQTFDAEQSEGAYLR